MCDNIIDMMKYNCSRGAIQVNCVNNMGIQEDVQHIIDDTAQRTYDSWLFQKNHYYTWMYVLILQRPLDLYCIDPNIDHLTLIAAKNEILSG